MSMFSDRSDVFASPATPAPAPEHHDNNAYRPTPAFVGISWMALLVGATAYLVGLWNAHMDLSEKGLYLALLLYGLFAAVTVQKAVRDRQEGVPVTALFSGLAWASVLIVATMLTVSLWNAELARSEKGFYAMSMALAAFGAVAVQKNVRDLSAADSNGD